MSGLEWHREIDDENEPFCAFRFSFGFSEEVANTRRWSSSSPISASVKLKKHVIRNQRVRIRNECYLPSEKPSNQNQHDADGQMIPKFRRTLRSPISKSTGYRRTNEKWRRSSNSY